MIIFERKYPVNVFDTDFTGRLRLESLFDYFQDLAGRHASALGFGREHLMTNGFFWVLSRMRIEIKRLPYSWEEVTIRTWPRGTEAVFALRDHEMTDKDGNRLAAASSSWLVVDYTTRKVQRPERALSYLNASFPDARALSTNAVKVPPAIHGIGNSPEVTASSGDIDVNMHVNNARYARWIYECYETDFLADHQPHSVDVNYLSEGHKGDRLRIMTLSEEAPSKSFIHSFVRSDDDTELCRMRIQWTSDKL